MPSSWIRGTTHRGSDPYSVSAQCHRMTFARDSRYRPEQSLATGLVWNFASPSSTRPPSGLRAIPPAAIPRRPSASIKRRRKTVPPGRTLSATANYSPEMHGMLALRRVDRKSGTTPFLKWPGGKRWLIRQGINVPHLSASATYFEPFFGAGSLFFALQPHRAVLSDVNEHLMATCAGLRKDVDSVIADLQRLQNDPDTYERLRRSRPRNLTKRAARLIYLNRTCFSGIYRENQSGQFNTPYGWYTDRRICQASILREASVALKSARLETASFQDVIYAACPGDFVYIDPPYILGHQSNGFARYNRHLFSWDAQQALARSALELAENGVHVLVSNAAHESILNLYPGFFVSILTRHNQVSASVAARGRAKEYLLASFPGTTTHYNRISRRSKHRPVTNSKPPTDTLGYDPLLLVNGGTGIEDSGSLTTQRKERKSKAVRLTSGQ